MAFARVRSSDRAVGTGLELDVDGAATAKRLVKHLLHFFPGVLSCALFCLWPNQFVAHAFFVLLAGVPSTCSECELHLGLRHASAHVALSAIVCRRSDAHADRSHVDYAHGPILGLRFESVGDGL